MRSAYMKAACADYVSDAEMSGHVHYISQLLSAKPQEEVTLVRS